MSRLAIIIPHFGDTAALEETLASVLANRPAESEIVVVQGRPYADPYALGDEVRFVDGAQAAGVAAAVNLGVAAGRAAIVHTLACGTTVCEGWADAALSHFQNPAVGCVAPLLLDAESPETVLAAGTIYREGGDVRTLHRGKPAAELGPKPKKVTAPHAMAAFWRREALEAAGGAPVACNARVWNVDLGLSLRQLGFLTVLDPRSLVCAAAARAFPAGRLLAAMDSERLFWRWAPAVGWTRALAMHAALVAAEGFRGLVDLGIVARATGRTLGCLLGVAQSGRRRHVAALAAQRNAARADAAVAPTPRATLRRSA